MVEWTKPPWDFKAMTRREKAIAWTIILALALGPTALGIIIGLALGVGTAEVSPPWIILGTCFVFGWLGFKFWYFTRLRDKRRNAEMRRRAGT